MEGDTVPPRIVAGMGLWTVLVSNLFEVTHGGSERVSDMLLLVSVLGLSIILCAIVLLLEPGQQPD